MTGIMADGLHEQAASCLDRASERQEMANWWVGLPGTDWSEQPPPRVFADKVLAMMVALRRVPEPNLKYLTAGVPRDLQLYADQILTRWLQHGADLERYEDEGDAEYQRRMNEDGYRRRMALCWAVTIAPPEMGAERLIDLSRGLYNYTRSEIVPRRRLTAL